VTAPAVNCDEDSIATYLVARLKLTFGRAMAALADVHSCGENVAYSWFASARIRGWYCCRALLVGSNSDVLRCGEDISFDLLSMQSGHADHLVDPTPRSIRHVESFSRRRDGRRMLIEAGPLSYEMTGFAKPILLLSRVRLVIGRRPRSLCTKGSAYVSYSAANLQQHVGDDSGALDTVGSLSATSACALSLLKLTSRR